MASASRAFPKTTHSGRVSSFKERFAALEAGIGWQLQLAVFLLAFLAFVSRRPDAVLHAQFFAEDGSEFYAPAYHLGLRTLFLPVAGYFAAVPRLAAALAQSVPLHAAPLVMNLVGLTFQVLPVNILLSGRLSSWGSLRLRSVMALAYIALPSSYEIDATVTDAQWHLPVIGALLALSLPPRGAGERVFDVVMLLLFGLTGVFCLPLLAVVLVFWWLRRDHWRVVVIITLMLQCVVQFLAFLFTAAANRSPMPLGANLKLFVQMLAGDVYLSALIGMNHAVKHEPMVATWAIALAGTGMLVYFFWRAPLELKLFGFFAYLVLAASLLNAQASRVAPQWPVLVDWPGVRYWFLPILAFVWALLWTAFAGRGWPMRIVAGAALGLMCCVGVIKDWRYEAYADMHFHTYTRKFQAAAVGQMMTIPIDPPGWWIRLTKLGPGCETLPIGHFDEPADRAKVSGLVKVWGWAGAAGQQIQHVSLEVDGRLIALLPLNIPRADVNISHGDLSPANKGWQYELDTTKLTPDQHTLIARAREANGCDMAFDSITIERIP